MKSNGVYKVMKKLLAKLSGLSRTQVIAASVAAAVTVGGAATGGYLIYQSVNEPKTVVAEAGIETEVPEETENLVPGTEEADMIVAEILVDTEVIEETETAEVEARQLSLVGTSMEKDLKIKIQDQKSRLVAGEDFEISVKADTKGAKAVAYDDHDKDGIIYINKLKAGMYTVDLKEIEGYEIKKGSIKVEVKDKLAYEKVDVAGEIKTENEIDASIEDTAQNNIPEESKLTDTLPLLESTVTATKVEKKDVDVSNFPKANVSDKKNVKTLKKTVITEKPDVPDTEEPTEKPTEQPTEKPTEKPTEQPTEKPTEKPTEQPTEKPTEQPTEKPTPPDTANPGDGGTESIIPGGTETASISRNAISRTATADQKTTTVETAVVSIPSYVNLYYCNTDAAANTCNIALGIDDPKGIIKNYDWKVNDTAGITSYIVASDKKSISITGKAAGSAKVTVEVTYVTDEKDSTKTETLDCTVNVGDYSLVSSVQLQDKAGNKLYIDDKGKSSANVNIYDKYETFYTAPNLYTGWQTIDGKVYYYGADHKAVTGNQVIGGVKYTFASDGSLSQSSGSRGIDVSKWQGNIDWGAVASSGISYAIIRAGYRGASTGALIEDPYFRRNIAGATKAGIKVGVYFFTQAVTEAEAVEEASMVLSLISGYKVTYPIFIDTENASNGRANGLDVGTRTAVCQAFCKTIQNAGYKAGVYASKNWYNAKLNTSVLNGYTIWVAQYNSECTYSGKYDMWQYTSKGSVPGIKGNVDMNISYLGY